MSKFTAILATAGALALGYAVYFDYSRRSSPEFRKKLRKARKNHEKLLDEEVKTSKLVKVDAVKAILTSSLEEDPIPVDIAEREQFFMSQVGAGEQYAAQPNRELEAALSFYRALSVYPNPTDLLQIYQKTIPPEIYEYLVMMIAIQPPQSVATFLGGASATSAESSLQIDPEDQD